MPSRIQFGWTLPSSPRTQGSREAFLTSVNQGFELVKGHFDSAWIIDHLQTQAQPLLEGWTALTYFAALQPEFDFGHTVLCQSFRNPALLAKMAATLQYLSGGRFILGIGAGWKEDEYKAYGYDFPSAGTRVDELEEALTIIKALWHSERATVQGKHYRVENAYCEPKPDPLPIIMVGGAKPRMLRLVARYADWWNVSWTGIDTYRREVKECERACAEVGRDPATLRRTWFGGCLCAPTQAAVEALNANQMSPNNAFVGTPAQLIKQMRPFVDLGVDYFMLSCGGFPNLTTLEMLVNEVLPALNH
jgi:alkanesulfonate monooxygenase SsuD/methylene tetrahydromethanopterin reductase-like flavin-dependent oxidoreductase (luciferase family)